MQYSFFFFYLFRIFLLYNQLNTNKSISSQSCIHSDIFHCEDMGYWSKDSNEKENTLFV